MRNTSFTDILVMSSIICSLLCLILVLQITIITKATTPADQVLLELRSFREQVLNEHINTTIKIDDVIAFINAHIADTEVLPPPKE